ANRVGHVNEYDGDRAGLALQCADDLGGMCEDHVGPQTDQLFRQHLRLSPGGSKTSIDADIVTLRPSEPLEFLSKFRGACLGFRIVLGEAHQHRDVPHTLALLRTERQRPRRRRANERDEIAALHVRMAPAWQEIIWRAAQKSLAVMCPACSRSPEGLLALMESANRGLITRAGSMSQ